MKKTILSLLLATCLVINMISPATTINLNGSCGRNLHWNLKDGILTISGTGEMYEPEMALEEIPWYLDREQITTVVIESGVTSICLQAFTECNELVSISIPSTITHIGAGAFFGCDKLSAIYYSGSESQWNSLLRDEKNELPTSVVIHFQNSSFGDVPASSWYAEPVAWAVAQGITTGTSSTTFSPDDTCTNAQVLTFIWRACGKPEPTISNPFTDVDRSEFYYKPALWAYENGMVYGAAFQANKPCTRSMAVTYLWKEAGSPETSPSLRFTDVSTRADYAQAVAWAVDKGITDGTSASEFSPQGICSRAQIVTFLYRSQMETNETDSSRGDNHSPSLEPVVRVNLDNIPQDLISTLEYFSDEYDSSTAESESVFNLIMHPFFGLYGDRMYPGNHSPQIFGGEGHLSDPILDKLSYRNGYYYHEMFDAERVNWIAENILNSPLPHMTGTVFINDGLIFYQGAYYQQYGDGGYEPPEITITYIAENGSNYQIIYKYQEFGDDGPAETKYAVLQPKEIDGTLYWSVLQISNHKIFDVSHSEAATPTANNATSSEEKTESAYSNFLKQKEYLHYLDENWLREEPSQYAVLDIDGNGYAELIVVGKDGTGFQNFLIFGYNENNDIYNIPIKSSFNGLTGICYGGLEYSAEHHALAFSEMHNTFFGSYGFWTISNDSLQVDFLLHFDSESEKAPKTYKKGDQQISEAEFQKYMQEASAIAFKPIP